jgi:hypothetical protein
VVAVRLSLRYLPTRQFGIYLFPRHAVGRLRHSLTTDGRLPPPAVAYGGGLGDGAQFKIAHLPAEGRKNYLKTISCTLPSLFFVLCSWFPVRQFTSLPTLSGSRPCSVALAQEYERRQVEVKASSLPPPSPLSPVLPVLLILIISLDIDL